MEKLNVIDIGKIDRARAFAHDKHDAVNQKYGNLPYTFHVDLVGAIAHKYMRLIPEEDRGVVISAAYLHDVIEDCRITYNDLEKVFGQKIADIVYALTNEKGKNRAERANDKYYEGILNTEYAVYVKLCDRMANVLASLMLGTNTFEMYKKEHVDFLKKLNNNKTYFLYMDLFNDLSVLIEQKTYQF